MEFSRLDICKKVAQRDWWLTTNKNTSELTKTIAHANMEHPVSYVWKPTDHRVLDNLGHGVEHGNNQLARTGILSRTNPTTQKPLHPPRVRLGNVGMKYSLQNLGTYSVSNSS